MNSNWKLLPAALLVAVLALAGCGGGDSTPTDTGPTPEEEANQRADEAERRAEEAEAEAEAERQRRAEAEAAAAAEAAQKAAATLRSALSSALAAAGADTPTAYHLTTAPSGAALRLEDAHASYTIAVMGRAFNKQYSAELDNGRVTLAGTPVAGTSVGFGNAKADVFATAGSKTHNVNTAVGTTGATFVTPGTYHGVSGTFTCTPADANTPCSSSRDATDALALVGGWTFAPSSPTALVTDGEAVQYGWWHDDLGKATEEVRVFYAGKDASALVTSFVGGTLGGKATYSGSAAGLYAIHRGAGAENDSGAFTADATLEADFGTTATIGGMINGFIGADGQPRDWTVTLISQSIGSDGTFAATTGDLAPDNSGMTVWTMGDDKASASGGWFGGIYASDAATTSTPTAVAGAFGSAHGNIGNMMGSFGAGLDN